MAYKPGFQHSSHDARLERMIEALGRRNKTVWFKVLVAEARAMSWRGVSTAACIDHLATPEPETGVLAEADS